MGLFPGSHTLGQEWFRNQGFWGTRRIFQEITEETGEFGLLVFHPNLIHRGKGYIHHVGREGKINWRLFTYVDPHSTMSRVSHPSSDGMYTYPEKKSGVEDLSQGATTRAFFEQLRLYHRIIEIDSSC
jgi:hypothetical protein